MRMLAQRAFLAWLAVATGACPCTAQTADASQPGRANVSPYPRVATLSKEDRLAVIGDVQRTSFWGRLVLAENNLAEQRCLVDRSRDAAVPRARLVGGHGLSRATRQLALLRRADVAPATRTAGWRPNARARKPRLVFPGDGQPRLHGQPPASDSPLEPTIRGLPRAHALCLRLGIT